MASGPFLIFLEMQSIHICASALDVAAEVSFLPFRFAVFLCELCEFYLSIYPERRSRAAVPVAIYSISGREEREGGECRYL